MSTAEPHEQSGVRGFFRRLTASQAELEAEELQEDLDRRRHTHRRVRRAQQVLRRGYAPDCDAAPRGGAPALEAELYDGSDVIDLVWLGRRQIAGIEPGRRCWPRAGSASRTAAR